MRKRVGIHGATDESLALIPLLSENPGIEISRVADANADAVIARLSHLEPGLAALLVQVLSADIDGLARPHQPDGIA